jgi:hypothetical protein
LSCKSDGSHSDIANGSKGRDWKEAADGDDIQTQTTLQLQGLKHVFPEDAPTVAYFCAFFYSAAAGSEKFVTQTYNYSKKFLQPRTDLPSSTIARNWKNLNFCRVTSIYSLSHKYGSTQPTNYTI